MLKTICNWLEEWWSFINVYCALKKSINGQWWWWWWQLLVVCNSTHPIVSTCILESNAVTHPWDPSSHCLEALMTMVHHPLPIRYPQFHSHGHATMQSSHSPCGLPLIQSWCRASCVCGLFKRNASSKEEDREERYMNAFPINKYKPPFLLKRLHNRLEFMQTSHVPYLPHTLFIINIITWLNKLHLFHIDTWV